MRLPLFLALLALPAFAEAPLTGQTTAVARLIEAHRLYLLGQSAHDPLLVLAAARLMQAVTLQEVSRGMAAPLPKPAEPDTDKKSKAKKDKAKEASPTAAEAAAPAPPIVPDPAKSAPLPGALNPRAMMAEARAMVPAKDQLRDVIADAESETPPPGPVAQVTSLVQAAGGNTTFALPMAGDSYAEVGFLRLSSDLAPTGHLTFTVTDAAGNPVCVDASATASSLCGIVPKESATYRVTVTNDGPSAAAYLLITN